MGSPAKMGVGTNVQERLVAMHVLDCPWRPDELLQIEGRGIMVRSFVYPFKKPFLYAFKVIAFINIGYTIS
ncbi:hypothetical protein HpCOL12_15260 [Helicobacter pylori]